MALNQALYAIAYTALDEVLQDGPLFMDALIVRIWRSIKVPYHFELVDAGVRLAIDEGWLKLVSGKVSRPYFGP